MFTNIYTHTHVHTQTHTHKHTHIHTHTRAHTHTNTHTHTHTQTHTHTHTTGPLVLHRKKKVSIVWWGMSLHYTVLSYHKLRLAATRCTLLHQIASCCNAQHFAATHAHSHCLSCHDWWRTPLQSSATRCNALQLAATQRKKVACYLVVQSVAVCCSVMQCVSVFCSVL